jgi:hypothetical protein
MVATKILSSTRDTYCRLCGQSSTPPSVVPAPRALVHDQCVPRALVHDQQHTHVRSVSTTASARASSSYHSTSRLLPLCSAVRIRDDHNILQAHERAKLSRAGKVANTLHAAVVLPRALVKLNLRVGVRTFTRLQVSAQTANNDEI